MPKEPARLVLFRGVKNADREELKLQIECRHTYAGANLVMPGNFEKSQRDAAIDRAIGEANRSFRCGVWGCEFDPASINLETI
jgi:hypothetical protein